MARCQDKLVEVLNLQFPLENDRNSQRANRPNDSIRATSGQNIRRATLIAMIGMVLAKLTGFVRELLIVPKFGYGMFSDAYYNAFMIPDMIYEILVGGVVAAVLTPTLAAGIERGREKRAWRSVSIFISLSIVVTAIALFIAEILAGPLMSLVTGAYSADATPDLIRTSQLAVPVTRVLLFQSFLMILVSFLHGILSAYKRFTPVAIGPSIYNIFFIFAIAFLASPSEAGLRKVAWGVVFAALIYFTYQAFAARRELRYFKFSLNYRDEGFKDLFRLAIPTLLSGSVLHLSTLIMNRFANGLNLPGAVTAIRQCTTTWGLPYAIFAVSVGNVMLPNISGFYEIGDVKKVRSLYTSSLRRALYFVIPFALAFAMMNFETIQAIFQWNPETYTNQEVSATASALTWFCVSMVAQTVVFITNQAFYARKVTAITLFTGILSLVMNPLFLILYVSGLGKGLAGIGMAHASYSVITAVLVYWLYKRHRNDMRPYRLTAYFIRIIFCVAAAALVIYSLQLLPIFPTNKIVQLAFYGLKLLIGLLTYYLAGIAIRLREALKLQEMLRSFFRLPKLEN